MYTRERQRVRVAVVARCQIEWCSANEEDGEWSQVTSGEFVHDVMDQ